MPQDTAKLSFEQRLKAERQQADRSVQQLSAALLAAQEAEREARMRRRQLQTRVVTLTGGNRQKPHSQKSWQSLSVCELVMALLRRDFAMSAWTFISS